jgi:hypothetical protein
MQRVVFEARPNLNREDKNLEELFTEFHDIFATRSEHGRRVNGDIRLIRQPPRILPLAKQAEENEVLQDMKQRAIEESDSPRSLLVVLVRINEDLRFCVEERKMNDVTKDCFTLRRIGEKQHNYALWALQRSGNLRSPVQSVRRSLKKAALNPWMMSPSSVPGKA